MLKKNKITTCLIIVINFSLKKSFRILSLLKFNFIKFKHLKKNYKNLIIQPLIFSLQKYIPF